VNERTPRLAGIQPLATRCIPQRRPHPWRVALSARPFWLATIHARGLTRRRVPLAPTAGHARLQVVEPRWWEAPMLRSRVTELHYITPVKNLLSIVTHGILSHSRAARVPHVSVAADPVQDRRAQRRVPRGRPLHEYANLYFDARNAMMYMRRDSTVPLTVVRLHSAVLDLPSSVITDGNAASSCTIFLPSPDGLARLDEERIYAESWDDPDPWRKFERKRARCAELLVPDRVEPRFILGCYVDHQNRRQECLMQSPGLPVEVNAHVFFK
jgi:hypothetical protein